MVILRSLAALVAAVGLLAATAGTLLAAFQIVELSANSGPVGSVVTVRVQMSTRLGGSNPSQLFLVGKTAFQASRGDAHCEEIQGANAVGGLSWHEATIEFQGGSYPGFVGEGTFTVPNIPVGAYFLAETLIGVIGVGCHVYTAFDVGVPDTASSRPRSAGLAVMLFLAVVAVGYVALQLDRLRPSRR